MRTIRFISFGALLLASGFTHGQAPAIVAGEYFLNSDPGVGNAPGFSVAPGASVEALFNGNTSALLPGLHSLNIRFKDAGGHWGIAKGYHFLVVDPSGGETFTSAPNIVAGEYFLNTDPGVGSAIAFNVTPGATTQAVFLGDASALLPGLHSLNIRFKDADGHWGITKGHHFLVVDPSGGETFTPAPNIVAGEYFLNADPGVGSAIAFNVTPGATTQAVFLGDASALLPGLHSLNIRFKDADGHWGIAKGHHFLVIDPSGGETFTPAPVIVAGEYFLNTDPGAGNAIAFNVTPGATVQAVFLGNASVLPIGAHSLMVRFKDAEGHWGIARPQPFNVEELVSIGAALMDVTPFTNDTILPEGTYPLQITVGNSGANAITGLSIEAELDGAVQSSTWTGTIAPGDTVSITTDIGLSVNSGTVHDLIVRIDQDDTPDNDPANDTLTIDPFFADPVEPHFGMDLGANGSYLTVADHPSLDLITDFTLECWVRPGTSDDATLFHKKRCGVANGLSLVIEGGELHYAWIAAGGNCTNAYSVVRTTGPVLDLNKWSHVALVHRSDTVIIMINGVPVNTFKELGSYGPNAANNEALLIGAYKSAGGVISTFLGGRMDECRVWNEPRTTEEIRTWMVKTDGLALSGALVSVWHFGEGGGPVAQDDHGSNDATLVNGAVYTLAAAPVQDGITDCQGVLNGTALPGTPCTIGAEIGTWSTSCICDPPGPDVAVENVTAAPATIAPGDTVTVEWTVHNVGNAPAAQTWTERIYVQSASGQNRTLLFDSTFTDLGQVAEDATLLRSRSVPIPSQFNVGDQCVFVVELVPGPGLVEQSGAGANNTGVQQTPWNIQKLLVVQPAAMQVQEGASAGVIGTVMRSGSLASPLVVDLSLTEEERFSFPASITIPVGQPGRTFTVVAVENNDLEGPVQASLTASSSGFLVGQGTVNVQDNEQPALTITGLPSGTMEGDTLVLHVSTPNVLVAPLQISLLSSNSIRFPVPPQATIAAGDTSVQISATLAQDNVPELDITITVQASASGHAPANASTTLGDDDMPGLELLFSADTVSESGGAAAAQGVLRRTVGSNPIAFTADLSASLSNTVLLPASLSLATGENEKTFTIGVVNNSQVDGFRDVTITAALQVASCGCSAPPTSAGFVEGELVVADNDGPSLTLIPTPLTLAEGQANAGTLRIQRNTPTDVQLIVDLSSANIAEATLPTTAIIPIGAAFVDVAITTISDGITDGSQQVYLHGTAAGFAPGIAWVIVTDVNKPDLQIAGVSVPVTNVPALGDFTYSVSVTNSGFATAPSGVLVQVVLSADATVDANDMVLAEHVISTPIPVGATVVVQDTSAMPTAAGNYHLLFRVNPLSAITELLYTNNTSAPVGVTVAAAFTATASVLQPWYFRGTTVPVTGSAQWLDGSPAANQEVEVYVLVDGLRRELNATTNAAGAFSTTFVPLANEAGHYTVGASYPGIGAAIEQDAFDLLGVSVNNGAPILFFVTLGDTLHGKLPVRNLCNTALSQFALDAISLQSGTMMEFDTIPLLAAQAIDSIAYSVTGSTLSPSMNMQPAELQAAAVQGDLHTVPVYYHCQAPSGYLTADITQVNATVSATMGEQLVELRVRNIGAGTTGNVQVILPQANWLSTMTPAALPPLSPGDTAVVILRFQALTEVPFDYPISGTIVIDPLNGESLVIPFTFTKVSETSGDVVVDVVNEFTYYVAGAPKVEGALVTIKHYFTGQVYAQGLTDSTGMFVASDVPEGTHRITVTKEQHQSYSGTVMVVPGGDVTKTVFLSYQAITFSWTVVPTAIEDEYTVELTAQFETNVPIPVVTIAMPDSLPQLFEDEVYAFNVELTNHGLITAQQVALFLPQDDPEYEFLTNYAPADLAALSSIQVPVLMQRRDEPLMLIGGGPTVEEISLFLGMEQSQYDPYRDISIGPCRFFASIGYFYVCDIFFTAKTYAVPIIYIGRECNFPPTPPTPGLNIPFNPLVLANYNACLVNPSWCPDYEPPNPPNNSTIWVETEINCKECFQDLLGVAACRISGPAGEVFRHARCTWSVLDWWNGAGGILQPIWTCVKKKGAIKQFACIKNVHDAMGSCLGMQSASAVEVSAAFEQAYEDLSQIVQALEAEEASAEEIYGPLIEFDAFGEIVPYLEPYLSNETPINASEQSSILVAMAGFEFGPNSIQSFFERWNSTLVAWEQEVYSPTAQYPDIIDRVAIVGYLDQIGVLRSHVLDRGFDSVEGMYLSVHDFIDGLAAESNTPCASVTVQLSQTLTMTREAFTGTLGIFNGHPSDAMDSLSVDILITDADGVLSNGLFQINTQTITNLGAVTGTGNLAAQENGSVQFQFIPTIAAAPTVPKPYNFGGSVTYWDPFVDTLVTMPLNPVQLTVNPSPDLMLHYFLERNILGDDALTTGVVEPSVPAELAVMIENDGYGPAVNLTISSAQPEIIENESGLAIDFNLIGSNLQGQPTALGVTNINFGTVPPLGTRIGQWYLTSSLLGKFVAYDAQVVHNNSFGNTELSLIQGAELHELTRSIKVYGAMQDGINDFLVNDLFDPNDVPDVIYLSQGNTTYEVLEAASGSFSTPVLPPTFTNTLTVTASEPGWNYIKLNDPGAGQYDLVSVTRQDGQVIPLNNAWLTFVTLPVAQQHFYEDKFHFVDTFALAAPVSYTVVWTPRNFDVPEVTHIDGAPEVISATQVTELTVVFSKPIDPASFTHADLTLVFQGGPNIMNASATIAQVNDTTFTVDLAALTLGNGTYVFTVQAAGVADIYGIGGLLGEQVSWTQYLSVPAVLAFQGIPDPAVASSYSTIDIQFNMPIDVNSVLPERFTVLYGGAPLLGSLTIDSVSADLRLFHFSGLDALLTLDGEYELVVDMPEIRSTGQVFGLQEQSVSLVVDNAGPLLVALAPTTEGALDAQHRTYVEITLNEPVVGFNVSALQLTRDGAPIPLDIAQLAFLTPTAWRAGNFGLPTYPDGDYVFYIDMGLLTDALGNAGSGVQQVAWSVDRSTSIQVSDLSIDPDLGYSDTDGISSTLAVDVLFTLSAPAAQVTISQLSFGSEQVLVTEQNLPAGPIALPVVFATGGNTGVKVVATGSTGGSASAQRSLFLDQLPLTAAWDLAPGSVHPEQLTAIPLQFSEQLLDDGDLLSTLQLRRNGLSIPMTGLTANALDETNYFITGIDAASAEAGAYELTIDLSLLHKHSSGRPGMGPSSVTWTVLPSSTVRLAAKVFLEGPYDPNTGLMHDSLRVQGVLPLTEPFTSLGFTHAGSGGGELVNASAFDQSGPNAIVDWVLLELRSASDASTVFSTRSALLQRDGDIVDVDGTYVVAWNVPSDSYYIAVRHRNHLGVMVSNPLTLGGSATSIDFTLPITVTYGNEAQKMQNGAMMLWAGNTVNDGSLKYTGSLNDRDPILVAIGGSIATNTISGYFKEDTSMEGKVKYTGQGNDRDLILVNIGGTVATNVRVEQLP